MDKMIRLEIPINFKNGIQVLEGSVLKWNENKKYYELKLKGSSTVVIQSNTVEQFPKFFKRIEYAQ